MPLAHESRRPHLGTLAVTAALACIFGVACPRVGWAAWPSSPYLSLPVAVASGNQGGSNGPSSCSDGAGGAFIAWSDTRTDAGDIYMQHVTPKGVADPAWPANGRLVFAGLSNQIRPAVVSDGSGGVIVAWGDARTFNYDIYAQHVLANGTFDPAWPATGRLLCGDPGSESDPRIVTDGAGGAIVAWTDQRGGDNEIYATRVRSTGAVDPAWPLNGQALCAFAGGQFLASMCVDGAGGAFVAWQDARVGGLAQVYATHVGGNGVVAAGWNAPSGQPVNTAAPSSYGIELCSDGGLGAYIAWYDFRTASSVYASHLLAGGVDPLWVANGVALSSGVYTAEGPKLAPDGAGGCYVAWADGSSSNKETHVQRLTPSGAAWPGWPSYGAIVITATSLRYVEALVADATGAIVLVRDVRNGTWDIYAGRVRASSAVDPYWTTNGVAVAIATQNQWIASLAPDGLGGAIAAWTDQRNTTDGTYDLYAQRVTRNGYLGTPEGEILSVRDVPNDQGRYCKLTFAASYIDLASDPNFSQYLLYRSVPPNLIAEAVRAGARVYSRFEDVPPTDLANAVIGEQGERFSTPDVRTFVQPFGAQSYGWEYAGGVGCAHYLSTYGLLVPTTGDSTAAGNPKTAWMTVLTGYYNPDLYFMSYPDSGYSVDNLAPLAPAPFTGQYAAGEAHLHWNPNAEPDVAEYRLYRGSSPSFVPTMSNRVAAVEDTGFVDVAGGPFYYKLSAVDLHGNESLFATLLPAGTVDAPISVAAALELAAPAPNPSFGRTTFRFALPAAADAELAIYDANGRFVRRLASGRHEAGAHALAWDLRGADGRRVPAGLYFVRLTTPAGTRSRRIAALD